MLSEKGSAARPHACALGVAADAASDAATTVTKLVTVVTTLVTCFPTRVENSTHIQGNEKLVCVLLRIPPTTHVRNHLGG